LFNGYGTSSFALKRLGIDYELVGYSDIDKYANQCFKQNHCSEDIENKLRLGDCTKIVAEELPDFDLLTGGFPCQSFSIAGKRKGYLDTRGTLFHEIIRIAEVKQPKFMLLENVKGLTTEMHKKTFEKILDELDRVGYTIYWRVLNSCEQGIPQNRERVWFVCFRNDIWKQHMKFKFPAKEDLKLFLKDILEPEVDDKYYLSAKQANKLLEPGTSTFRTRNLQNKDYCSTLQSAMSHGNTVPLIQQVNDPKHSNNRVYSSEGISPTLRDMSQGGNRQPFVLDFSIKTRKVGEALNIAMQKAEQEGKPAQLDVYHLKHSIERPLSTFIPQNSDIHRCLQAGEPKELLCFEKSIRKLTPKECFRLMGFLNDEVDLKDLSNTQKYRLAGNGQDVNVVTRIFKEMFR